MDESKSEPGAAGSGLSAALDRLGKVLRDRPGVAVLGFGVILFWLAYAVVLMLAQPDNGLRLQILGGFNNAVSALLVASALMALLRRFVIGRSAVVQAAAHVALAPAAALIWYIAVIVGIGLRTGSLTEGFSVNPFPSGALSWQILQGFLLYAAVTGASYAIAFQQSANDAMAKLAAVEAGTQSPKAPEPQRLMVRDGSDLVSVELSDIILGLASNDYVEIVTAQKRYLSRQTMAHLMERLPERFVRVHRSRVVNLDRVLSAEPAGDGRLTVHLDAGHSVTTSRAGARAIKDFAR